MSPPLTGELHIDLPVGRRMFSTGTDEARRAAQSEIYSAIAASPGNRALAKSDSDFDPIRDEDAFIDLVYAQAS